MRAVRMSYFISRALPVAFEDAVARTVEALKAEGFGVLTDIDVKQTCNPALAHEALRLEDKVGTMLPCNVIVQDLGGGSTEVAAIDPVASMQAIDNAALKRAAEQVRAKLERVIQRL
jgi:uncharacterized protein (DUF302 family)